jgi:hypothetical protein
MKVSTIKKVAAEEYNVLEEGQEAHWEVGDKEGQSRGRGSVLC